jgi:Fe2+ or Zn2+ uptake regulation protein
VQSVPAAVADAFTGDLQETYGFQTDISHVSIHGRCAKCGAKPNARREPIEDA